MYIVAQHRIKDPARFWAVDLVGEKAPVGVFASYDRTKAVCLFESDSSDTVRGFLDPLVGDAAENAYFEVDAALAVGLPERAATSV